MRAGDWEELHLFPEPPPTYTPEPEVTWLNAPRMPWYVKETLAAMEGQLPLPF